jgi:hypothetical protein
MKVWPLTSTNTDSVCLATSEAICVASASIKALFKILALIIPFFSNCFLVSPINSSETPLLPTKTAGDSVHNLRLMRRFFPAVISLMDLSYPFRFVNDILVCLPQLKHVMTMWGSLRCFIRTRQFTPGRMKCLQHLQTCSLYSFGKRTFAAMPILLDKSTYR